MCGRKLKRFSALSVLFCLLSFSPLSFSCFAEVKLTDEEAETILSEISESKKELEDVKSELTESKKELEDVKNTYNEQKTSYETQLDEAEKENQTLKTVAVATGSTSIALLIVTVLLIIF